MLEELGEGGHTLLEELGEGGNTLLEELGVGWPHFVGRVWGGRATLCWKSWGREVHTLFKGCFQFFCLILRFKFGFKKSIKLQKKKKAARWFKGCLHFFVDFTSLIWLSKINQIAKQNWEQRKV